MIILTGDIHHSSLKTGNQKACDITEIQVAQKFLHLISEANVKVTFFITGKAFAEEWNDLKSICENPLVSVQGHTYYCFTPELMHRIWKKLTGNYNGPYWYQQLDVKKTIEIIREKTGQQITCWRNHMYMHGPNTDRILADAGIKICSDGVNKNALKPTKGWKGLYNFPINVIPDHEHLYHAERTQEWVEKWIRRYNWSDDFGNQSYPIEEWTDILLEQLKLHESKGVTSNMIIHPITMYLCDRFHSFKRILDYLASRQTIHLIDVPCERENS